MQPTLKLGTTSIVAGFGLSGFLNWKYSELGIPHSLLYNDLAQ